MPGVDQREKALRDIEKRAKKAAGLVETPVRRMARKDEEYLMRALGLEDSREQLALVHTRLHLRLGLHGVLLANAPWYRRVKATS